MRLFAVVLALALAALAGGCGNPDGDDDSGGADAGTGPDGPADPGPHPGEVWMMTWNIETFPKSTVTVGKVAGILAERPIDLVAVQEIDDNAAFGQLDESLGAYAALIADDPFGDTRVGLLYRPATVTVVSSETIFKDDQYAFPRPPLVAQVASQGVDFTVVVLHLKALGDDESVARRRDAILKLDAWLAARLAAGGEQDIVLLGDWNDKLTDTGTANVFQPMLNQPDSYTFLTLPLAEQEDSLGGTYIPFESFIDHVMITNDALAEFGAGSVNVLALEVGDPSYQPNVSDHRPVLVKFKPGP